MTDNIKVKGTVTMIHTDKDGNVISEETGDNLIVDAGLSEIVNLIGDGLVWDKFGYIALGTDNTTVPATGTALGAEITTNGASRVAATVTQETTTTTGDTLQLENTFNFTGSLAIEEVWVFNAATGGDMLGRKPSGTKNVSDWDALKVVYKIKFA